MPRKTYTDLKVENEALRQLVKDLISDYRDLHKALNDLDYKTATAHNHLIELREMYDKTEQVVESKKTTRERMEQLVEITGKKYKD